MFETLEDIKPLDSYLGERVDVVPPKSAPLNPSYCADRFLTNRGLRRCGQCWGQGYVSVRVKVAKDVYSHNMYSCLSCSGKGFLSLSAPKAKADHSSYWQRFAEANQKESM
jgi:DnaJ-class molecular chaperone